MRIPPRTTVIATALTIVAATALAACGDDSKDATTASAPATTAPAATPTTAAADAGAAGTIKLSADPGGALAFDTDTLTAKAGEVTLDMKNPESAGIPHAIAIEGNGIDKDGPTAQPGGSSSVTVTLKPGTYTFYCPVAGHEAGGMKGTLTVS